MRKPPHDPPLVERQENDKLITEVRRYKVITPLFGGGVEPGEADPVTVVRATEVRGHLRFWWRATRGGAYNGDLEKMRKDEDLIWGSSGGKGRTGPSDVSVVVTESTPGNDWSRQDKGGKPVHLSDPRSDYSYVAFPLRAESNKPAGKVRRAVEFTLSITYPEKHKEEIASSIWAWETFGGIGARTRRGFGALCCISVNDVPTELPNIVTVKESVTRGLKHHVKAGVWPSSVPHLLYDDFKIAPSAGRNSADEAWRYLFGRLKSFRQARFPNKEQKPYGRSKWPEADAIRRLTGTSADKHKRPRLTFDKFPRAVFGLPIIFQFKDVDIGDPRQTRLEGAVYDRMASPLILRPLACAQGKYVGVAIVLGGPRIPPGGLMLKEAPENPTVSADLSTSEARQIEPLDGDRNVLQAFLDWL